jgi:hypothetical protein
LPKTQFLFLYRPIPNTTGTLTGTVFDGTPINLDFARASTATITLPEPSGLAGLASGVALLMLHELAKVRGVGLVQ